MADSDALRARRYRQHRQDDHSLCRGACGRLQVVPGGASSLPPEVEELERAVRAELGEADPLMLALALRLVRLSAGSGPAAVQAVRALGELMAQHRDAPPAPSARELQRGGRHDSLATAGTDGDAGDAGSAALVRGVAGIDAG